MKKLLHSRRAIASALLGLFLFVLGMAQFEALHKEFHSDAGEAAHECAVTLLKSGQIDTPTAAALTILVPDGVAFELAAEPVFIPRPVYFLLPGRAPPPLA